jgi:hypothetical protein
MTDVPSRTRMYLVNAVCWSLGALFVIGGGWVLDRVLPPGLTRDVMEWLLIG